MLRWVMLLEMGNDDVERRIAVEAEAGAEWVRSMGSEAYRGLEGERRTNSGIHTGRWVAIGMLYADIERGTWEAGVLM